MQAAADAAALAATKAMMLEELSRPAEVKKVAKNYFNANYKNNNIMKVNKMKVKIKKNGVRVIAKGRYKTLILGLIGIKKMPVTVVAEAAATASGEPTELVFVLDTTASMAAVWHASIGTFDRMLRRLQSHSGNKDLYVSFIELSDRANVGTGNAGWLNSVPAGWNGCVQPREENIGGIPWVLTDKTPSQLKFSPTVNVLHNGWTYHVFCPKKIVGPTNNINLILNTLRAVRPVGTGRFDEGMAWAWRLISPKWRGLWGVPKYPADYGKARKIIVFATDGHTVIYEFEVDRQYPWGRNNASPGGYENLVRVCNQIKSNKNTEIYFLHFTGAPNLEPYAKACASSKDHYFRIYTPMDVNLAIGKIGGGTTTKLRLVR